MTQDEIIEMAREAGGFDITSNGWTSWVGTQSTDFLERFAKLVAAKALAQPEQEPWCMKMNGCKTKCEDCPEKPNCGSSTHD